MAKEMRDIEVPTARVRVPVSEAGAVVEVHSGSGPIVPRIWSDRIPNVLVRSAAVLLQRGDRNYPESV